MRISDWSSDVCSSDLVAEGGGRAALEAAARLIREQTVEALYLGPRLRPQLDHSVTDACGPAFVRMPADPRLDGSGVVLGIVDYGCDFAPRNFRKRTEARRVGQAVVSACNARRQP